MPASAPKPEDLRRRIVVEKRTETISAGGASTDTWATYATLWAKYEPLTGREFWSGTQEVTEHRAVFTVRYSDKTNAITNKDYRVVYDGKNFEIEAPPIDPTDERRFLVLRTAQRG